MQNPIANFSICMEIPSSYTPKSCIYSVYSKINSNNINMKYIICSLFYRLRHSWCMMTVYSIQLQNHVLGF